MTLLFVTRFLRLFAYGFLSVVLVLYLTAIGFGEAKVGLLLTLTLLGDTIISLFLTTTADRFGRRRTLIIGAWLMALAGIVFALSQNYWILLLAATLGVISPSGNEVGPFLSIEQASLSHLSPHTKRTMTFAWYNLTGNFAAAFGSLFGGTLSELLQGKGYGLAASYHAVLWCYAAIGIVLALIFQKVSSEIEVKDEAPSGLVPKQFLGLHKSRSMVFRLSALFSLDAFAGGFVIQGLAAYWFHLKFGIGPAALGGIFFGANLLSGFSQLAAAKLAHKIGLVRTMVFTHLPSNLLLILVPLMPTLPLAIIVLLIRFSISQMDVPTRQSYTMAVVSPDERSAAAGVTGVARTVGASLSPSIAGALLAQPTLISVPFILAGILKIIYDLILYRSFVKHEPDG
ncbi:MAG: MFS transporter [Deltaproteobacteria bacterium]|nr:MFS transporter [Deltaproteobacteria bacterium]